MLQIAPFNWTIFIVGGLFRAAAAQTFPPLLHHTFASCRMSRRSHLQYHGRDVWLLTPRAMGFYVAVRWPGKLPRNTPRVVSRCLLSSVDFGTMKGEHKEIATSATHYGVKFRVCQVLLSSAVGQSVFCRAFPIVRTGAEVELLQYLVDREVSRLHLPKATPHSWIRA